MDKVVARTLRPWEGRKLHQMKRQLSNAVNCRYARIVLLSRGKVGNREISQCVGCTPQWVRKIIHRFNDGGIDAITWCPYYCNRAGPRKFMADVTEQIAEVALSSAKVNTVQPPLTKIVPPAGCCGSWYPECCCCGTATSSAMLESSR